MVRCNKYGEIEFLKDLRRLNVAMTRAKCGVVVIGNKAMLIGLGRKVKNVSIAAGDDDDDTKDFEVDPEYKRVWRELIAGLLLVKME